MRKKGAHLHEHFLSLRGLPPFTFLRDKEGIDDDLEAKSNEKRTTNSQFEANTCNHDCHKHNKLPLFGFKRKTAKRPRDLCIKPVRPLCTIRNFIASRRNSQCRRHKNARKKKEKGKKQKKKKEGKQCWLRKHW
jgi:hypothetical protein